MGIVWLFQPSMLVVSYHIFYKLPNFKFFSVYTEISNFPLHIFQSLLVAFFILITSWVYFIFPCTCHFCCYMRNYLCDFNRHDKKVVIETPNRITAIHAAHRDDQVVYSSVKIKKKWCKLFRIKPIIFTVTIPYPLLVM